MADVYKEGSVVYAWDIIPFTVPETKKGEEQEVFTHLLPNLQTDSAYVLNIKVTETYGDVSTQHTLHEGDFRIRALGYNDFFDKMAPPRPEMEVNWDCTAHLQNKFFVF
jgi:hypothetical protein